MSGDWHIPTVNDLDPPYRSTIATEVGASWEALAGFLPATVVRHVNGTEIRNKFKLSANYVMGQVVPGSKPIVCSTTLFGLMSQQLLPLHALFDALDKAERQDLIPAIQELSQNIAHWSPFFSKQRTGAELAVLARRIYSPSLIKQYPEKAAAGVNDSVFGHADQMALCMLDCATGQQAPLNLNLEALINKSGRLIQYHLLCEYPKAVVRININNGGDYGSGFLTRYQGHLLIMTNNHVLRSETVAAASFAEFDVTSTGSNTIRAKFRPDAFWFTRDYTTPNSLDVTLVAFDVQSDIASDLDSVLNRAVIPLEPRNKPSATVAVNHPVFIFQHPNGRPLEFSFKNTTSIPANGVHVHYDPDTEEGSSGSPVLNGQFDLIAIHHAGLANAFNEGVLITAIRRQLDAEWSSGLSRQFPLRMPVRIGN
eukprot:TRINITY_DN1405_c0_g4_i2.p1 TRINITY_DN1405_c0_g4~~TRINITY_DN1405_c0_g4_i2.p1  ORF type:complete len:425 (+),score=28.23 TRINITY_DN1405_c0_g4_i2:159-1433(+)